VGHVDEVVLGRHPISPLLDLRSLHLDRAAAGLAHKMVVMVFGVATPVPGLAVFAPEGVDFPGLGQESQLVVNSRESDVLAPSAQFSEQVLSGAEPI
jgi:hypothetical protein